VNRKRIEYSVVVVVIIALVALLPVSALAKEATIKSEPQKGEAAKAKPAIKGNAALTVGAISGNKINIDLTNDVPVRGVQFTVEGIKIVEVRTTERTKGFIAKFNERNGIVILVSTTADAITPGKGPALEVLCDKPGTVNLLQVRIAGANREPLVAPGK